jgi:hypothetical protein
MHPMQARHSQDEASMADLADEIKEFIVRGLARYDSPSQVAVAVKAQFGVAVSRQQVFAYDPEGSRPPAPRWIALHAAAREKFLSDVAGIGVAHKAVRLRLLDRWAREADERHATLVAATFLEQAARECGGIYESRRAATASEVPPKMPAPDVPVR